MYGSARDVRFDILKGVGIFAIVLAHIPLHPVVFQLRNFEVPLLVLCSGALYGVTDAGNRPWPAYLKSRLVRLLVPCWIFLTIYFLAGALIDFAAGVPFRFTAVQMLAEYALRSRVIGLWVIRVFVFVALLAPALAALRRKHPDNRSFLPILGGCYLLYELANAAAASTVPRPVYRILAVTLFEAAPYGILFGLGLALPSLRRRHVALAAIGFAALHLGAALVLSIAGRSLLTQGYKHPPTAMYVSYAIAVSLSLYLLVFSLTDTAPRWTAPLVFLGSSSLWVYLWHWLAGDYLVPIVRQSGLPGTALQDSTSLFPFVLAASMLLVWAQHAAVRAGVDRFPFLAKHRRLVRKLFLG